MILNPIREALVKELSKLPLPGDSIIEISNNLVKYESGAVFPAPKDDRLKEKDTVKEITYELYDDELYISINHSHGILDKVTFKSVKKKDLIKATRLMKLERIY